MAFEMFKLLFLKLLSMLTIGWIGYQKRECEREREMTVIKYHYANIKNYIQLDEVCVRVSIKTHFVDCDS